MEAKEPVSVPKELEAIARPENDLSFVPCGLFKASSELPDIYIHKMSRKLFIKVNKANFAVKRKPYGNSEVVFDARIRRILAEKDLFSALEFYAKENMQSY